MERLRQRRMKTHWALRPGRPSDVEAIAELRAVVLRPDLERLGRFDEVRVRQRFRDGYSPTHTSVVTVDGAFAGSVAVRPAAPGSGEGGAYGGDDGDGDDQVLEHFYLAPAHQGRGLGTAVLRTLLLRADTAGHTLRLDVLQGSPARRLYERHGFTLESEDSVDVFMVRRPGTAAPGPR